MGLKLAFKAFFKCLGKNPESEQIAKLLEPGEAKQLEAPKPSFSTSAELLASLQKEGRFALLLNRVRWEDAGKSRHAPERVQTILMFSNVQRVSSQGVNKGDADTILSLLHIEFTETDAPSGDVLLTLAGDGVIRLTVEALDVTLKDVTRPYVAPSRKLPEHPA